MLIEHLFVDACVCVCVCAHVCAAWIGERWKERKSLNVLLSSNNCANTSNTISLTRQNYSTKIRRRRWMCASRYLFLIRTHTIFMFQPFAADEQAEDLPNFPFRVLYAKASITISDITCISRTSCWSVKRRKTHKNTKQQFNERKKTQLPCYHFTIFFLANIYKELRSSIEEEYVHYVHMSRCGFHIFRLHWSDIEDEIIRQYIAKRCSPWKWPTLTRYKAEKKKQRRHIAQLFKFLFPTVLYIFRSNRFFFSKSVYDESPTLSDSESKWNAFHTITQCTWQMWSLRKRHRPDTNALLHPHRRHQFYSLNSRKQQTTININFLNSRSVSETTEVTTKHITERCVICISHN